MDRPRRMSTGSPLTPPIDRCRENVQILSKMGTIQVQVPGGKHGSSHFLSRLPLLLRGGSGFLPFLLFVMPRGWSKAPVMDGWVQIIRGPRPKSEKWPKAGQQKVPPKRNQSAVSRGHPQPMRQWERDSALLQRSTSRPPEAAAAEASLEVERLQGAIAALGEGNPLSAPLQAALRSARTKSKVLPVNERVEACKGFLERAKKRLVRTEAVIAKAHEQKLIFEAELREGEARLLQLQAESEAQPEGPSVTDLQSRIDQLIQERDALLKNPPKTALPGLWMTDGTPPIVQEVPPMPEDRQDLEGWLSCRNCELRNALEFGDVATVGKVGALVAQGSARMVAFAQDIPMNGQAKSSLMSVLIDQADAKRRCIEATQMDGSQV